MFAHPLPAGRQVVFDLRGIRLRRIKPLTYYVLSVFEEMYEWSRLG